MGRRAEGRPFNHPPACVPCNVHRVPAQRSPRRGEEGERGQKLPSSTSASQDTSGSLGRVSGSGRGGQRRWHTTQAFRKENHPTPTYPPWARQRAAASTASTHTHTHNAQRRGVLEGSTAKHPKRGTQEPSASSPLHPTRFFHLLSIALLITRAKRVGWYSLNDSRDPRLAPHIAPPALPLHATLPPHRPTAPCPTTRRSQSAPRTTTR